MFKYMSDKDKILKDLYYNESGYQSINNLYKEAKEKDKTITLNYVKGWYKHFNEPKTQLKGSNSYIAPDPYFEYQLDLFFVPDQPTPNIGLACIDIFTKYAVVVPLENKQPEEITKGLFKAVNKMGKKPKIIYTDEEGSFNSNYFQEYLKKVGISHLTTRTHPWYVERYIKTFKNLLYKRLQDIDKTWIELIEPINNVYNNKMKSSVTNFTPTEARNPDNLVYVKINLELNRKQNRRYPDIEVGDKIKIYKKKKLFDKENKSVWLAGNHQVEEIINKFNQTFYKVSNFNKLLSRHEILKVS